MEPLQGVQPQRDSVQMSDSSVAHYSSSPSGHSGGADSHQTSATEASQLKDRKRVGFAAGPDGADNQSRRPESTVITETLPPLRQSPGHPSPQAAGAQSPIHSRKPSGSSLTVPLDADDEAADLNHELLSAELHKVFGQQYVPKPRPVVPRGGYMLYLDSDLNDLPSIPADEALEGQDRRSSIRAQEEAHERAQRLAMSVGSGPTPASRRTSIDPPTHIPSATDNIPLLNMGGKTADIDDFEGDNAALSKPESRSQAEAHKLVRSHTRFEDFFEHEQGLQSGQVTPVADLEAAQDHVPRPQKYRGGILGSLLKLYNSPAIESMQVGSGGSPTHRPGVSSDSTAIGTPAMTPQQSPPGSGTTTPRQRPLRHWYHRSASQFTGSLTHLVESSSMLASPVHMDLGEEVANRMKKASRPGTGKWSGSKKGIQARPGRRSRQRLEDEIRITVHIAETISRQRYLLKLCRALMSYGAPTHRLEQYMKMSARVLEIEGQFLYIPGCMVISFDDTSTHTAEVKLVKTAQGVDLGKLRDTHEIYKEVVHDLIGVEEATQRLDELVGRKPKYNPWVLVPVYGLASATVGPFAFGARLIDLPLAFLLGCILGLLQLIVAPHSELYSNVFEITAAVITSFLARAFGSIRGGNLFCFSALAQSSIALILPGYTVLCASLELQSRSIVAGSVRMVYAIMYSLFLGYGITIGTVLFGLVDKNATSATTCQNSMPEQWSFLFVAAFTLCLIVINQAKWKQAPVMIIISMTGYVVNFYSSKRFQGNTQVSNTLGALAIGILANLYSRLGQRFENKVIDTWERHIRPKFIGLRRRALTSAAHLPVSTDDSFVPHKRRIGYGVAAASMLPAIFVQVPSGLAVSGSLISGITSADQIAGNASIAGNATVVSSAADATSTLNSVAFNVGYSVIQVAIGITVGLFLSALLVYPLGKRRSGLFSF